MFKRIDHVEIVSGNIQRSIDFYTGILNFKIKAREKTDAPQIEEIVYLELGNTVIELLSIKKPRPATKEQWQVGYRMIALEVEDMDSALEYLKGRGVEITWGPVTLGNSKRAEIRDPDGLGIELRQW